MTPEREFRFSNDGTMVAIGTEDEGVCILRVSDLEILTVEDASYDFGGCRLAVDSAGGTLFSGAYFNSGIAAYEIETAEPSWERRDLKKLQKVAYDSLDEVILCSFEDKATRPLIAATGRERTPIRGLKDFFFSKDCRTAFFDRGEGQTTIECRDVSKSLPVSKESFGVVDVAFTKCSVVVSWAGGPVTSYEKETGKLLWRYMTEGTHAFVIAPASNRDSVWIGEQPFEVSPWNRLRCLSGDGQVEHEVRCNLTSSYALVPEQDQVVQADLTITAIQDL